MTNIPVDHGWAWATVVGSFINTFFVIGGFKSSGIIFLQVLSRFEASSALTAWMMGLMSFGMALFAPLATALAERLSYRFVSMLGGCFMAAGFLLSIWAPNVYYVVIVLGMFVGVANAFLYAPSMIVVGQYFNRHRAMATGLALAGASVGQLVVPLLITYLLHEYHFEGAMMIYSAFTLHAVAASALFRPPSFYSRRAPSPGRPPGKEVAGQDNHGDVPGSAVGSLDSLTFRTLLEDGVTSTPVNQLEDGDGEGRAVGVRRAVARLQYGDGEGEAVLSRAQYTSTGSLSFAPDQDSSALTDIKPLEEAEEDSGHQRGEGGGEKQTGRCCGGQCGRRVGAVCRPLTVLCDRNILCNPVFIIYVVGCSMANCGYIDQFLFIPPYGRQLGLDADQVSYVLAASGLADLVGRVLGGLLANLRLVPTRYIMVSSLLATALSTLLCTSLPSFAAIMAQSVTLGLIGGAYIALFPVVLVDFVGLEIFPRAFGLAMLFVGSANLPLPTIFGKIYDETSSYMIPYWICAWLMVAGAVVLMLYPCARRLEDRRAQTMLEDGLPYMTALPVTETTESIVGAALQKELEAKQV